VPATAPAQPKCIWIDTASGCQDDSLERHDRYESFVAKLHVNAAETDWMEWQAGYACEAVLMPIGPLIATVQKLWLSVRPAACSFKMTSLILANSAFQDAKNYTKSIEP
jgi:hypothetical protein